jgi:nucleotide-binding universal stress UspA family protein
MRADALAEANSAAPSGTRVAMRTIVVGFDGSPAAERALERAAALRGADGRVVVVTATASLPPTSMMDEPVLDSPSPDERDALLERAAVALRGHGIEPVLLARDLAPAEALLQAARSESADLIVVGSTGSGYVTRAIVGSTAENVVRQAPCDVLIVR